VGSSPPLCAPFLSTGAQIATTHADGSLKLWTLSTDSQTRISDDPNGTCPYPYGHFSMALVI
jgi:hypothetical protein